MNHPVGLLQCWTQCQADCCNEWWLCVRHTHSRLKYVCWPADVYCRLSVLRKLSTVLNIVL